MRPEPVRLGDVGSAAVGEVPRTFRHGPAGEGSAVFTFFERIHCFSVQKESREAYTSVPIGGGALASKYTIRRASVAAMLLLDSPAREPLMEAAGVGTNRLASGDPARPFSVPVVDPQELSLYRSANSGGIADSPHM